VKSGEAWSAGRFGATLGIVFLLAFGWRLLAANRFVGLASAPDLNAQPDQGDYEEAAARLAAGDGYALAAGPTYLRPPGTSAAIAMAYRVAGRSYLAARVWFCFLSATTCVLLGMLAGRLFDRTTGIVAASLLAATPAHWYYALHLVSELPYSLLITAAVAVSVAAWRAERDTDRLTGAIGTGVLYAAAALVRPQAVFALPSVVILFLASRPETRRRSWRFLLVALLAFAVVTGAWVVRNARVVGHPTFAGLGSLTFWGAHNEQVLADPSLCGSWVSVKELLRAAGISRPADEGQLVELAWRQGVAFVRANAADLPRLEVCKLRHLGAVFLVTPNAAARVAFAAAWLFTAPLALAGVLVAWRRNRAETALALVPIVALLAAALVFYGSIRFRHSTEPLLVLFAARGLTALRRGAGGSDRSHRNDAAGVVISRQA